MSGHRGACGAVEVGQIVRDEGGQVRALGVVADLRDRVEVRGVARQPLRLDSVHPAFLEDADRRAPSHGRSSKAGPAPAWNSMSSSTAAAGTCRLSRSAPWPEHPTNGPHCRGRGRRARSCRKLHAKEHVLFLSASARSTGEPNGAETRRFERASRPNERQTQYRWPTTDVHKTAKIELRAVNLSSR